MTILNVTVDLISSSITDIHGPVDFDLLKDFEQTWIKDNFDDFLEYIYDGSEWAELLLTFVPAETLEGRITAPAYYSWKILDEGKY
jgi:hypothetical protein